MLYVDLYCQAMRKNLSVKNLLNEPRDDSWTLIIPKTVSFQIKKKKKS